MSYEYPLKEVRELLIRKIILQERYKIPDFLITFIEQKIQLLEREFKMRKHDMNKDIQNFEVYVLTRSGKLKPAKWIKSTDDYNHYYFNLHHFIPKQHYEENKKWYDEQRIKQFLVLLPVAIHEQLHGMAIKNLSDEDFKSRYKISKWDLLFNRKYSKY